MKPMERRIGIYLSANEILENPGYLEALRDALGLNLVIVGFSGQLPAEVRAASPFDGMRVSDGRLNELLVRHLA